MGCVNFVRVSVSQESVNEITEALHESLTIEFRFDFENCLIAALPPRTVGFKLNFRLREGSLK